MPLKHKPTKREAKAAAAHKAAKDKAAETRRRRVAALEKARAARSEKAAARRAETGEPERVKQAPVAGAAKLLPGPEPFILSPSYRLIALDHRNWGLQKLRGGNDEPEIDDDSEGESTSGNWFTVGYHGTVEAACNQFAQRSAREATGGMTLPAAIGLAVAQLRHLLAEIRTATAGI